MQTEPKDLGFRALNALHRSVVHLTHGRIGASLMGMPAIELVTTGRRTGLSRSTMLTVPVVRCDQWVLVASKGGDDRDPEWFLNLVANPEVTVNRKNEQLKMRARIANESESKELWPQVVASYKPYASYQRRSKRSIPLVICEPR